jgi:aspartyl-tRNA(Asn)/glutamyl-tRNA(Gln) amidotransferase subunit B
MNYEAVIGLEVHAQLLTESKIFCSCSTAFGAPPNTHTCPVCLGMPGVLPVLNRRVVEFALRLALASDCDIAPASVFARKNYFYPDLPKGYQISMYEDPLARDGRVEIEAEGRIKRVGINRIHMEEDAGKLIHDEHQPVSYVDLNRTGVPLLEIVSEPDLNTPEEASAYLKTLRDILVYLEICDGNMEEGSFRCDANVSLRPVGQAKLGTRTEVKNMNSFRNVARALEYEIRRQRAVLEDGEMVVQETRLWNDAKSVTESMRGKEESHDYRYFPDPDLIPLRVDSDWIEAVRASLPELPVEKRKRFVAEHDLSAYDAEVLTSDKHLADYFESTVSAGAPAKAAANWIMSELLRQLNQTEVPLAACPIGPQGLARMIEMIDQGKISGKMAKKVFENMFETGRDPDVVVEDLGLVLVSDQASLEPIIDRIMADNPGQVEEYRGGKDKLLGFFVGQVMKRTQGQADPKTVNQLLKQKLKG